jgi:hypothetical protein
MLLLDILIFGVWVVSCSAFVGIAAYVVGKMVGEALGGPDFWVPRPAAHRSRRPSRYGLMLEPRR